VCAASPEPLIAATWLVPVAHSTGGGVAYGRDTTSYGPPPTTPGPGYIFSGNVSQLADAASPACDSRVDFHLPTGSSVTISWQGAGSAALPIDNLYLPGLGQAAALETEPLNAAGQQVVDQLGSGSLQVDGVSTSFECSGPGVSGAQAIWHVAVTAGQSAAITCTTVPLNTSPPAPSSATTAAG